MKKQTASHILIFVVLLFIDRLSKMLAVDFSNIALSSSFFLSLFEKVPQVYEITIFTCFYLMLFFIYALILRFSSAKLNLFKFSLDLVMAGILATGFDKLRWGRSLDIFVIESWNSLSFNLATLFAIFGAIILLFQVIKHHSVIFADQTHREQFFILKTSQLRLVKKIFFPSWLMLSALGVFSALFVFLSVSESSNQEQWAALVTFVVSYLSLAVIFLLLFLGLLIKLSNRIYGPLYAFKQHSEGLVSGLAGQFKLRDGDELTELEEIALSIQKNLKNKR